ncbi:hypothetical protein IC235_17720 [Hymenobacter sp. BT664]|uniref:Uncharacterized protein n=1 Tax=Hymenobacter montanus TaxID=2771359 RepID=A0A927BF61_9BACT|nr:hypothetical protein [Hymenobacter montanus]MBD2769732.1 hypothetical protein [Hymenobacter montanus]
MSSNKPPVRLTKSGKLRVTVAGTGPQEMTAAFVRHIESMEGQINRHGPGITLNTVLYCANLALVLDLYESQVVPQMRLDVLPEEITLVVSRAEGLLLWTLTMLDPAPVSEQVAWLGAMNAIHKLLS